ncbi:zinc-ribbon domain-containing protein, partial [uncultured Enorma sp.]|uniref:zinc-ribbon domain-containing protein n=1 Tax=uncultured Enorma sp. TaxID=1714346 RepID=UPI0035A6D4B0
MSMRSSNISRCCAMMCLPCKDARGAPSIATFGLAANVSCNAAEPYYCTAQRMLLYGNIFNERCRAENAELEGRLHPPLRKLFNLPTVLSSWRCIMDAACWGRNPRQGCLAGAAGGTDGKERTMFCPKCGAQNADGAQFCASCGAPIQQP